MSQDIEAPVLSIDYKLSPEYKFPEAIDQIYEVYVWLLDNAHQLGLSTEKIIITGDSAGGYLTLVLAIKSITNGIRVPDLLMPFYPSTTRSRTFASSIFCAAEEV
jgi:acetyl esterase/lipase